MPAEIKVTPKMIEAGKAIYREWEESVDYNGGWMANPLMVDELIRSILAIKTVEA